MSCRINISAWEENISQIHHIVHRSGDFPRNEGLLRDAIGSVSIQRYRIADMDSGSDKAPPGMTQQWVWLAEIMPTLRSVLSAIFGERRGAL